jgi:hypothetical protein
LWRKKAMTIPMKDIIKDLKRLGMHVENEIVTVQDATVGMSVSVAIKDISFPCASNVVHTLIVNAYVDGRRAGADFVRSSIKDTLLID